MFSYPAEKKLANWWETLETGKLLCTLCPRYCTIGEGQVGFCFIRQNFDGKLYSVGYGRPTGFAIDPIEKKPLNHFLPGSSILSFGTAGCNLGCKFCQNWLISKAKVNSVNSTYASPEDVILLAQKQKTPSIAFTYNDPVIWGEYVIEISKLAFEEKINSVMVTAGYIDKNARKEVFKYINAANVDLKSFSETFYHKLTFSHLEPVLDTLVWLKNETDIWVEITTLLIPQENDSDDEIYKMCDWILKYLGENVPLHFTAFHPDFKLKNKKPTPISTLIKARQIALNLGIKYCYLGNVYNPERQSTYCSNCKNLLIQRNWHSIKVENLLNGLCKICNTKLPGKF